MYTDILKNLVISTYISTITCFEQARLQTVALINMFLAVILGFDFQMIRYTKFTGPDTFEWEFKETLCLGIIRFYFIRLW